MAYHQHLLILRNGINVTAPKQREIISYISVREKFSATVKKFSIPLDFAFSFGLLYIYN